MRQLEVSRLQVLSHMQLSRVCMSPRTEDSAQKVTCASLVTFPPVHIPLGCVVTPLPSCTAVSSRDPELWGVGAGGCEEPV